MSVFPEKSPKIYHFGLTPLEFVCPPSLGTGLGGEGGGKNLGGGSAPFAPPPKPPLVTNKLGGTRLSM